MPFNAASSRGGPGSGKVKGTLLLARMKYLRAQGGESLDRVLGRLSEADQEVLRGMLLPSSWYPLDLLSRLDTAIAAVLSKGDGRALFLDMGRFSADTNLGPGGSQRPFVREDDPLFLLKNLPRMYSSQHTDGTREYEQRGPKAAVVRTVGAAVPEPDDCLTTVGWLKRAIELSGGREVSVTEPRCRGRGDPCCEYACSWT